MKTIQHEVSWGDHVNGIRKAVALSRKQKCFVRFNFDGIPLWASPKKSMDTLLWEWNNTNNRRNEKYRLSAIGQEAQRYNAIKIAKNQDSLKHAIRILPGLLDKNDIDMLMRWLYSFIDRADHIGVDINAAAGLASGAYDYLSLLFESKGYVDGQYAGQEPGWFNTRERMGRYIIGQALSFFKIPKNPSYPVVRYLIDRYWKLTIEKLIHEKLQDGE